MPLSQKKKEKKGKEKKPGFYPTTQRKHLTRSNM